MTNYIDRLGVKRRYKDVGDMNAIAVVDRSMGLLKKKLANIEAFTATNWGSALQRATKALNDEPKPEVLHGASPNEVSDDKNVEFMLLQDNASNMVHNQKVVDQRETALKKTMAFRAPISINRKIKRGFELLMDRLSTSRVSIRTLSEVAMETHTVCKMVKPVPADSREPATRSG